MTALDIKEMLAVRPFRPFRIIMSSGEGHEVRHPEMAFVTRTSVHVGVGDVEDGIPARFKLCAILHVATIEPLDLPTAQAAQS